MPSRQGKARPGTLDSESEVARPAAWGRDPEATSEGKGPKVGGERPDPRVPSVVHGLGCVRHSLTYRQRLKALSPLVQLISPCRTPLVASNLA